MPRASTTFLPRTRSTTRRAFWAEVERLDKLAFISCAIPASLRRLFLNMPAEPSGRGKFTKAMAHHIVSHINRHMTVTVVHSDGVTNHLGEDGAGAAPGADDLFVAFGIHLFN